MMESNQNTPQTTQQYTGPPQVAYNPDQPTIQNYVTITLKVFGGIHLTWAVVYIVLGMVDKDDCFLGSIGGPLFLVIGSFSLTTGLMKHKKLFLTMMIFSIICAMASGVMIVVASVVVSNSGSHGYYYRNMVPVKSSVILVGTMIECGISIASAVICSKIAGCRRSTQSSYTAMPDPQLVTSSDVTGLEGGIGYNQVWCSPQPNNKPGVATPGKAGVEPPAYDAQPESN